ncbi:MAG: glycosyl transferase [Hamadaea sp.]|uniref:hypothetical protein n=1 Tax=Hamadaea sp. TaxID=2024425 RepID=UPI0017F46936|nr:hypothetical protein [Hamadaea sp.]NUR73843.1 glycosyl transferase [Hamadaea sp.]NUT18992.1 glycosyl transferase [Hamadaea sp.]
MSTIDVASTADDDIAHHRRVVGRRSSRRADFVVLVIYLAFAGYVLGHLWPAPGERYLSHSYNDHSQFEWFLAVDTYNLLHFKNPFFTDFQNAGMGVNLLGNASVLGLALPLLPVTMLFGPSVAFVIATTLSLCATAFGWYLILHRELGLHRAAAVLGGAVTAYAPAVVSHANAHLNLISMFLVPWIVRSSLRLFHSHRPVRDGVTLGLLVSYQFFVGAEILLMTAIALLLFVILYALPPLPGLSDLLRRFSRGIGVAFAVAGVLLAYPLWVQFAGPRHYDTLGGLAYVTNDLSTLFRYSTNSLGNAGDPLTSTNYAEENAYFGWPLLLLGTVVAVWFRRTRLARAVGLLGLIGLILSLGPTITWRGSNTGIPGPWRLFRPLPVLDSLNIGRFTFITVVALGVLLALATDRIVRAAPDWTANSRLAWDAALAAALVPLLPVPLPVVGRDPVPRFFADGVYKQYIRRNHTVVPVPVMTAAGRMTVDALHWQIAANMDFRLPEGYFVGPKDPSKVATNQPAPGPVNSVLLEVTRHRRSVQLTPAQRAEILGQLRTWQADAIVVYRCGDVLPQLQATFDPVLGPGHQVSDVFHWDLRSLSAEPVVAPHGDGTR